MSLMPITIMGIFVLIVTGSAHANEKTEARIVEDEGSTNATRFDETNPVEIKKRQALVQKYVTDVLAGRDPEAAKSEKPDSQAPQSDK